MLAVTEREWLGGTAQYPAARPTLNIVQACARAGVKRRAIYYWIEAGKVEVCYTPSGRLRIYADSLLREISGGVTMPSKGGKKGGRKPKY